MIGLKVMQASQLEEFDTIAIERRPKDTNDFDEM